MNATESPVSSGWRGYLRSLSFRLMAATIGGVLAVAGVVHVLWQDTAEKNVDGIVAELNREILQGVSGTILNVSEDVAASQGLMRTLFEEKLLSTGAPREVEKFLLDLVVAKPLYTWAQIGFANGDFWGANRVDDGHIRLVRRLWDAGRGKAQRTVTHYRKSAAGLVEERVESDEEDYFSPDRPWYKAAIANAGKLTWSEVYLFASSRTPGLDSALALTGQDGKTMVLGIGFELKQLSYYLGRLPVAARGRVFLMDAKAQVVASSDLSFQQVLAPGRSHLPALGEGDDPLLKVAHGALANNGLAAGGAPFRTFRATAATGEGYFVTLQNTGYADWLLGTVIPEELFLGEIRRSQKILLLLLAGFAVLAAVLGTLMGKYWLAKPVGELTEAAHRIEQGDFDVRLNLAGSNEFEQLGTTFNYMAVGLKEREREKDIFGRVVSPEVREKLLAGQLQLGGETCWVAVVFSDIRGFSTLSERMAPQEVVSLLNEYMSEMSQAIRPWGGYINNFIGDAIVAVFGAPVARPDVEACAVGAALAMREGLHRLNQRRRERGEMEINSGIGISTGEAVAGQIGSIERLLYTVIGDAVNLASRLETMTKDFPDNPILVNGPTAEALQGRSDLQLTSLGQMPIKGRVGTIEVFSVEAKFTIPV